MRITRRVVTAGLLASTLAAPAIATLSSSAFAAEKPTVLLSVPGLNFPFFVHMMKALKAEAANQGLDIDRGRWPE